MLQSCTISIVLLQACCNLCVVAVCIGCLRDRIVPNFVLLALPSKCKHTRNPGERIGCGNVQPLARMLFYVCWGFLKCERVYGQPEDLEVLLVSPHENILLVPCCLWEFNQNHVGKWGIPGQVRESY